MKIEKSVSGALSLLCCLFSGSGLAQEKPVQTVLISFDGANDNAQWQRSLDLGRRTGAEFTYFLNCVYVLAPENKQSYVAPIKGAGKSNVGFGKSQNDVKTRLSYIWQAHQEGHEIASHTCGHFDGKDWTAAQWGQEFAQFDHILKDAWVLNGLGREPAGWRKMVDGIDGFRAPYLSATSELYRALSDAQFDYDASKVEREIGKPDLAKKVKQFALPTIVEGPQQRRIIAMDYNLFVRHSGGFERSDEGQVFEKRTFDALNAAFKKQYDGARNPVQFGLHFTLMNGGAYWRAVEKIAGEVCVKVDVKCVSYRGFLQSWTSLILVGQ
jgi:peptidoglycan/xylan/chitin deacetylase (PgdA/CDA1 family)